LSLVEVVAGLALLAIGTVVTVAAAATLVRGARMSAGAREMAVTLQALRWKSVAAGRAHGMLFGGDTTGWYWYEVRDGNGNGLRTSEVASGADVTLSGPHRVEDRVAAVTPGFPGSGPYPKVPPQSGTIGNLADPIKFGSSNLVSFTPLGRSSTGTLYLTDRRGGLAAVVLFGSTGRLRLWRYNERQSRWIR
jgi:Tfp pilus assembly protein FimT